MDGALAASGVAGGAVTGNTNPIYLGGDPDYTVSGVNERYFGGAVAQAAFFTNALTLAQIQATYQAALNPPPISLGIRKLAGDQVELNWNYGTLQAAPNAAGLYNDLPGAGQPYVVTTTNAACFYRVRR